MLLVFALLVAAPPSSVPEATRALLAPDGIEVKNAKGEAMFQCWFRRDLPNKSPNGEMGATLADYPHGVFLGVVQVGEQVTDRRGDRIPAGIYNLRLSFYPDDGAHQGIAPQRDFLILTRADKDTNVAATPGFPSLMKMAKEASGTNHPLALSCWKQDTDFKPGLGKHGESDTLLQVKIGDLPLAIIVLGKHEG